MLAADWLASLFNPSGLAAPVRPDMPGEFGLQAAAEALTGLACCGIAVALIVLALRRRDLGFAWLFWMLSLVFVAFGGGHLLAVAAPWTSAAGAVAAVTLLAAGISVTAAAMLWARLPRVAAASSNCGRPGSGTEMWRQTDEDGAGTRPRAGEAQARALSGTVPVPLHILDPAGRIVAANRYWLELLGYAEEKDVLGRPIRAFLTEPAPPAVADGSASTSRLEEARDAPCVFRHRSGRTIHALVSSRIEQDEAGRPRRLLAAVIDVTERVHAVAALHASEEALRQAQKMQAVGQLTGGIAHDFNNMLTVVEGNLELLRRRLPPEPLSRRLIESAMAASAKAERLTGQLLTFARRQRLRLTPLDPGEIVTGMMDLLVQTAGEAIRLELASPPRPAWLCLADRNQLESALLNLVLNARAAIAEAGTIRIAIAPTLMTADPSAPPGEEAVAAGEYVCLSVIDDGAGMTEEVRRHALEPFFTTKPAGQGTGLGLAQIHEFARQCGGTVRLASRQGFGTRVDILLPRAVQAVDAAPEAVAEAAPVLPAPAVHAGERVLVVDDDAELRLMAEFALRSAGYAVVTAAGTEEGLTALHDDPSIALLFSDVCMPGRDGVELALAARRLRPDMPVLFSTGYSAPGSLQRWPGRADVLQKPFRVDELTNRVRVSLDRHAMSHEAV
ncbi:MAG TPA: ATP-binding protein [Acetobacteraceae bacterium]|nr:ATP-binding protein [Acetobacteraceae bacterium]